MEPRPKIKIQPTPADKLLECTGWVILGFLWIFTLYIYSILPESIPIHFNAAGHANGYGDKITIIILPVIGTIIFFALTIIIRYLHLYNYIYFKKIDAATQYRNGIKMIRSLKTVIILLFALINVFIYLMATGKITGLGQWFLPFAILIIVVPQGYYIIKLLRMDKGTGY